MREKLKEITRQEHATTFNDSHVEPHAIQKAVSIRLWRLMQRRLRDPSGVKTPQAIRTSDAKILTAEPDEGVDNMLNFEHDDNHLLYSLSGDGLELDDEVDEEDLFHIEYESEWEDLFTDAEVAECPAGYDDDMLDCLHDELHDDDDENMFSGGLEDVVFSCSEEMLEL